MSTAPNPIQALAQAQAANRLANDLIRSQGIEMQTQLPPVALSGSINNAGQQINIIPRNVGLLKGFMVEFSARIVDGNAVNPINPTALGPLNFFSNIMFTDLQNNVRINCPGHQIALLNTLKNRSPAGFALNAKSFNGLGTNAVVQWQDAVGPSQGQNQCDLPWGLQVAANGKDWIVTGTLHIPIAYSDHDYRGAIFANVINGQMGLQLTVNPRPAALAGASGFLAMVQPADNATAITIVNTQVVVTQIYMDQLPIDPKSGLPILPQRDISTIYELKNTTFTGAVPGNDFPMQYPNFRDVLSSIVMLDSFGNTPLGVVGYPYFTPVVTNYWALQAANSTNIFRRSASLNAVLTRLVIGVDLPIGCAYFSYRQKPLSTTQYGNLQLVYNPSSVWISTNPIYHCWESFASIATISQAGSLAAGA